MAHPARSRSPGRPCGPARTTGPSTSAGTSGRAGPASTPANVYRRQQGRRVLSFSATFDPSRRLSFTSQVKRQEPLAPAGKAKQQESLTNQLTLAPASGTKLTLSQESLSKARPDGPAETMDALRAQIEPKFG